MNEVSSTDVIELTPCLPGSPETKVKGPSSTEERLTWRLRVTTPGHVDIPILKSRDAHLGTVEFSESILSYGFTYRCRIKIP